MSFRATVYQDSARRESAVAEASREDGAVLWTSSAEFFRIINAEKKKLLSADDDKPVSVSLITVLTNPSDSKGNYSATSNRTTLVHWPLMGRLFRG